LILTLLLSNKVVYIDHNQHYTFNVKVI